MQHEFDPCCSVAVVWDCGHDWKEVPHEFDPSIVVVAAADRSSPPPRSPRMALLVPAQSVLRDADDALQVSVVVWVFVL